MRPKIIHKLGILRSLLRVPTYLLLLMYLFVGFLMGMMGTGPASVDALNLLTVAQIGLCVLAIAAWYINGTALNDYADYEIDLINLKGDKDRPLVAGAANKKDILEAAIISGGTAVIASGLLSISSLLLMIVLLTLNICYSIKPIQISRRGGLAPLLLPMGYIVLPFFLGFNLEGQIINRETVLIVLALYCHFLGRIILKDYRDVKGDKAHNKMTFLLKHGNQSVVFISGIAITIGAVLTLIALNKYTNYFQFTIICLIFFGLALLQKLSKTSSWSEQKPLLAAFGRAMTGTTAATILILTSYLWSLDRRQQFAMAAGVTFIYLWSAQQAMIYNQGLQIQKTKNQ